jgi:hypothetical protein
VGVVSQGYRLVSNREALDWGYECCRTVFPDTHPQEWQVNATDAPSTGGHCFIDIVHNSASLDFRNVVAGQRPETYGPFIRVTNSYNGLRALSFDIGFFRKVCKNGLILPKSIIQFRFTHQRREIGSAIRFDVAHQELEKLKASFGEYLGALRDTEIPRAAFEPFVMGVLLLRKPEETRPNSREAGEWVALEAHINELNKRYADDLGETAYAVFNAITEFASQPPKNIYVRRERHGLQRLAGEWLTVFSKECLAQNFSVLTYLEKLAKANAN